MANSANFLLVPVKLDVAQTTTNMVNAAAVFRRPAGLPLLTDAASGGTPEVRGPQIWPR